MDNEPSENIQRFESLAAWLDQYTVNSASPELKARIRNIPDNRQMQVTLFIWTTRQLTACIMLLACIVFAGAWFGKTMVTQQKWEDAALIDTVLGPDNFGDVL